MVADSASDAGTEEADAGAESAVPAAEPISFKAVLEKAETTIGEPFAYTIEVRHVPAEKYSLPSSLDLGDFGVRSQHAETHGQDPQITMFRLVLQAFAVGDKSIPAIHLAVTTPDGERQLEIPPQKMKILGVIDDTQGPPQMKEDSRPLPTRTVWRLWPVWLLLAVAVVAAGVFLLRRRKVRAAAAPPPKPRLPAFDEAMQRLQQLEDENLVVRGHKQAFYFRLSEILRDFIGRRYEFDSLEMTSDELLHAVLARSTPGLDYDLLAAFTRESDLVKFARVDPSEGSCRTILDLTRKIVIGARPPRASDAPESERRSA
jgi:hypothetical protein